MPKQRFEQNLVFQCKDSDIKYQNASVLIKGAQPRTQGSMGARLAKQFIEQNRGILKTFDVGVSQSYDGDNSWIVFKLGIKVGAFPLLSPTSGQPDLGMIIHPRFDWSGIGSMLAQMGWRVTPSLLKLPLIKGTERKIPPWVLSSVILVRLKNLLDLLDRHFEIIHTEEKIPKGKINWTTYSTRSIPTANFFKIPCQYPSLIDDRELISTIHFTLKKQLASLENQRNMAGVVLVLIELCQSLLKRVSYISPRPPSPLLFTKWISGAFHTDIFREGIQALEWVIDEKGLAGLSSIQGIPWMLSMDEFFEAWIETLTTRLVRDIGGNIYVGRKRETITSIHWDIPYTGTQKYLLPDSIIERADAVFIFDAKYKQHWEEINRLNWSEIEDDIQERHRNDLLQAIAYSTLRSEKKIVTFLIYPCQTSTWESLSQRGQLFRHATIAADGRNIEVVLTAVPMSNRIDMVVNQLNQFPVFHEN